MIVSTFYAIRHTRPLIIWTATIVWLIILNVMKLEHIQKSLKLNLSDFTLFEVFVYFLWMVLRLVSYTIDACKAKYRSTDEYCIVNYLGFVFYMPTMLNGPPMVFERYTHMLPLNRFQRVEDFLERLKTLICIIMRLLFWYFLFEFSMHFIYANVVVFNPQVNEKLPFEMKTSFTNIYLSFSVGSIDQSMGTLRFRHCNWSIFLYKIHNCLRFRLGNC